MSSVLLMAGIGGCTGQSGDEPAGIEPCGHTGVADVPGLDAMPDGFVHSPRVVLAQIEGDWAGRARVEGEGRQDAALSLRWDEAAIRGRFYGPTRADVEPAHCPPGYELGLVAELSVGGQGGPPFAAALVEGPDMLHPSTSTVIELAGFVPPADVPPGLVPSSLDGTLCEDLEEQPLGLYVRAVLDRTRSLLLLSASIHLDNLAPGRPGLFCGWTIERSELRSAP
jgi:hypothetical protein